MLRRVVISVLALPGIARRRPHRGKLTITRASAPARPAVVCDYVCGFPPSWRQPSAESDERFGGSCNILSRRREQGCQLNYFNCFPGKIEPRENFADDVVDAGVGLEF